MARLRTRKHKVVLSRSAGGDAGITVVLTILGLFMVLPMVYTIMQALKPLDELWMYPPRFYVMNPTVTNFRDLFTLMNTSWVPFSRYICSIFITCSLEEETQVRCARVGTPSVLWMSAEIPVVNSLVPPPAP